MADLADDAMALQPDPDGIPHGAAGYRSGALLPWRVGAADARRVRTDRLVRRHKAGERPAAGTAHQAGAHPVLCDGVPPRHDDHRGAAHDDRPVPAGRAADADLLILRDRRSTARVAAGKTPPAGRAAADRRTLHLRGGRGKQLAPPLAHRW